MARETRPKIVRTEDGIQYEIQTDEPWEISRSDVGELLRSDQTLTSSVRKIARSAVAGLRNVGASEATVRFGVSLSGGGAFFISEGQSDAHVVIELKVRLDEQDRLP